MKYAKKFKLVPYSVETPASTQINAALTNSLRMPSIPDHKVKIYNTALTKLKELQDDNQIKPVLNTNYEIEQNDEEISKEIADLEKKTLQNKAGENLKDYSKSDKLNEVKIKRKKKFDNDKFDILLNKLTQDSQTLSTIGKDIITNNQNIQTKFAEFENLLNTVYNEQKAVDTFKFSTPGVNNWNLSTLSEPSLKSRPTEPSFASNNLNNSNSQYITTNSNKSLIDSDKSLNLSETINEATTPKPNRNKSGNLNKSGNPTQSSPNISFYDKHNISNNKQNISTKSNRNFNPHVAIKKLNQQLTDFYTYNYNYKDDYDLDKIQAYSSKNLRPRKNTNYIIPKRAYQRNQYQ